MTTICVKYNPYKVETSIMHDDVDLMDSEILGQFKNERLQVWIEQTILILAEEILNDDTFIIAFHGTTPDYEDLVEVVGKHNVTHDLYITLQHIEAKEKEDKIMELSKLVQHMEQGPFEELRDKKIKQNFEKAIDSEFEIGVIATMSSGKSTLINALLGNELMPSKNEACTAVIAQIKNEKGRKGFVGTCYDSMGNELIAEKHITGKDMSKLNENESISTIKIVGNIPSIDSHEMNLVLVDTPGPNNSMNSAHRDHTYRVIKNESKPMVLYVLNGTNLSTDDDSTLLSAVAEQMKVGGKQSEDRFIFAVNKIDQFDPEKDDDVGRVLKNVKEYLLKHGIENPNIFPVSAELAKVIRMKQNGTVLTRAQRGILGSYELFTEEPSMHLNQYSPLSQSIKTRIQKEISQANEEGNVYEETLYHTGVPAIEAAINEYLEKYAVTSKISDAIVTFQKIIVEQQMFQELVEELEHNEEEQKNMHEQMVRIERILEDGKKANTLKSKMLNLDLDITEEILVVQGKINRELANVAKEFNGDEITKSKAESKLSKCREKVEALQGDVLTDLEKLSEDYMINNAKKFIDEYKSYVAEIVGQTGMESMKFDEVKLLTSSVPDAEGILSRNTYTESKVVGTETVGNTGKRFYKPWTWFQASTRVINVYEDVEYVDGEKLRTEFIGPIKQSLDDKIQETIGHLERQKDSLRDVFIKELHLLDKKLLEKVTELKELAKGDQSLKEQIKINKEKKEWLDDLVERLDYILEI